MTFALPKIDAEFDKWLAAQLQASPADPKDVDDFRYITFTELPPFTDEHKSLMRKVTTPAFISENEHITFTELPPLTDEDKSLMRKVMTPELFAKLKDVKSSKGYSLSNAMQAGVLRPHLGVGFTAGDEECFTLFKDIIYPIVQECFTLFKDMIYPIVEGWHKFDPATQEHTSDLDWSKISFTEEQAGKFASGGAGTFAEYVVSTRAGTFAERVVSTRAGKFAEYVVSTRVRAARNIAGLALPAGSSKEERLEVEKWGVKPLYI
ncbi:ATP:guanido phosphotransferase [Baffinella frigidus]|nr:ATP:guanido phosphotransferase [Cryptophyta sp. CCMP2293]